MDRLEPVGDVAREPDQSDADQDRAEHRSGREASCDLQDHQAVEDRSDDVQHGARRAVPPGRRVGGVGGEVDERAGEKGDGEHLLRGSSDCGRRVDLGQGGHGVPPVDG